MAWWQSLDVGAFRFVNQTLSNPVFDVLMPFASGNVAFAPALVLALGWLAWRGGARGRLCALMLIVVLAAGDGLICGPLKHAFARPRPFSALSDVVLRVGRGGTFSMPSGHAANWFGAASVLFLYYPRSWRFMVPVAVLVSFSRVYNGVHYPSDVLAGALLGAVYGGAFVWALDRMWQWVGRRWFPLWWERLPSLMLKQPTRSVSPADATNATADCHWLRLGYALIFLLLAVRLAYLAAGKIELSEDEAYQWLWSKHPALSYFSKPPMIAYTQWLGTHLWGDTEFGIRFFAPVIGALLSLLLLRFLAREVNARTGFWLLLVITAMPLTAGGAILMTIDPLSVLFWTAAMIAGWRAVQDDATHPWLWCGLWMGLGFLSKYTALFQLLCWAVFFAGCPRARTQLRRPGPWLALLIVALCSVPVLVWNAQHDWITVTHLENRAGLDRSWQPTSRFFVEFVGAELGLLNPVFLIAMVWAAVAFWRREQANPLLFYFFSMGAPLFLGYLLYTVRARVQPNWIAPAVLPLTCLAVVFWESRRTSATEGGRRFLRAGLTLGLVLGLFLVVLTHDTNLVAKLTGRPLPPELDPLRRVRGWRETAAAVGAARAKLAAEGKPVFVIGYHYGLTGLLSFYLPEAKAGVPDQPLVYYRSTDHPQNQFYFWPGYGARTGENAIYVQSGDTPEPPPARLVREFTSVTDLGVQEIRYRDRVFRRLQLFECRGLR